MVCGARKPDCTICVTFGQIGRVAGVAEACFGIVIIHKNSSHMWISSTIRILKSNIP